MAHRSPHTNGDPPGQDYDPGLLRYRFQADPEQLDPEQNARFLDLHAERLEVILRDIWKGVHRTSHAPIDPVMLASWHRTVLEDIEPAERIGYYRHSEEQSSFQVWEEHAEGLRACLVRGVVSSPQEQNVWRAVRDACNDFQGSLGRQPGGFKQIVDAVTPCASFYTELLRIRPFMVDNDSISYLALHGAYLRAGLEPLIYSPRMTTKEPRQIDQEVERSARNLEFNHALARALQPNDASPDRLVAFLIAHARFR